MCRSELPYGHSSSNLPCHTVRSCWSCYSVQQTSGDVVKAPSASHSWGWCRGFRRAAAAGDELKAAVLDQMLKVLSAGILTFMADLVVYSCKYVLLRQ